MFTNDFQSSCTTNSMENVPLNKKFASVFFTLLLLLASCASLFLRIQHTQRQKSLPAASLKSGFVIRSNTTLRLNGKPFRFSGANIFWLGMRGTSGENIYPTHFEVDDALATASFMGATVVRSHTLGISVGCPICIEPARGTFNNTAFQHIDYAIQSASMHHIKLIIPLTDNWHYFHGGKHTFTYWRNIPNEKQFYTNTLVIHDFKQYISMILNHKNHYTGRSYKDDPTIMAWETGNELTAPFTWVQDITTYIKSIDQLHLILDGNRGQNNQHNDFSRDLSIKAIDLYSGHYYPPDSASMLAQMKQTIEAKKVFIVGEYDWNTNQGDSLNNFLWTIEQNNIAGDLYWSLLSHDDMHGFVMQNEHFSLYYPGDTSDLQNRVYLLYAHAYRLQGVAIPKETPPGKPFISSVDQGYISWRGAYGALNYSIERSSSTHGPWTIICNRCATDYMTPWRDNTSPGGTVWYRIRPFSLWGVAGPYSDTYQAKQ
jgi:mannan endo-1,4-beta-mannosidase